MVFLQKSAINSLKKSMPSKRLYLLHPVRMHWKWPSILIDIKEGDEIILPSFTFVSTANPFILRGAKLVFVDSRKDNPGIDESLIEPLITNKTKAIVIVHYAGIACDMDAITKITEKHQLFLIEDAAQAIDSYYKNKPLGSFRTSCCFFIS